MESTEIPIIKPKKKGGKMPGAGRPKGSTTRPKISDYLSAGQMDTLVKRAFELANMGNETMLKFILEHHFGKAVQPVGNDNDQPLKITFDNAFTPSTEESNTK